MTVSAETNKVIYDGDGATVAFDFTFQIFQTADIKAILVSSAGVETTLTETTDYAVTGSLSSGGKVTLSIAPAIGEKLLITIDIDLDQETDLIYGGSYSSQAIENMSDKLTKIAQQHDEALGRAVKFKASSSEEDVEFPELTAAAVVKVKNSGDGLEMGPTLPALSTENSLLLVNAGKTGFDEGPPLADLVASKAIVVNSGGDSLVMGPSTNEISNAQTYAEAAQAAKTAAELAETNAEADATQTALDATSTAADVVLTHADVVSSETAKTAAETAETNTTALKADTQGIYNNIATYLIKGPNAELTSITNPSDWGLLDVSAVFSLERIPDYRYDLVQGSSSIDLGQII
ncbi:MAG: hypothetical protein Q7J85_05460 [Bacillota bacterium]|nr:hypothetical protein [Bacillota bacterium]